MVKLLLSFLGPVVGAHLGLNDQLIADARVSCDCFAKVIECDEPEAGNRLSRIAVFILAGVVVAEQIKLRVSSIAFGEKLRVLCKIADGSEW